MNVTITQESAILLKAEARVPWDQVNPHYDHAMKEIRKSAQVPGFRKGKAPSALLKKKYRPQILNELAQHLVPGHIQEFIADKQLKAVGTPRLVSLDFKEKEHFEYIAELDVLPEIELNEWRGLEVESLIGAVDDDMVEEQLQNRVKAAIKKIEITDRPVEKGDLVTISLTVLDTENEETLTDLERYQVDTADDSAHPILREKVIGLSHEEDLTAGFEGPEDDSFEKWRGRSVKAYIEVLEITQTDEPALDDAFAVEQGSDDLESLKQKIREDLTKEQENKERDRLTGALIAGLLEDYDFEVPWEYVKAETQNQVQTQMAPYMQMLQGQEQSLSNQLFQNMYQHTLPQTLGRIRSEVVMDKIAESLGIATDPAELDKELEGYLEHLKAESVEDLKKDLEKDGRLDVVERQLKRKKVVDHIREEAKITMVDQLTSEQPNETEEETENAQVLEAKVIDEGTAETVVENDEGAVPTATENDDSKET